MYEHLFSPLTFRGLTLKNRIVLPGIGTKMSCNRHMSDQLLAFHLERTKGGCGLNVFEVASVHAPSAPQGFLGIHDDDCIPGLSRAVSAIHDAGGKASIQLWQGGINVMWDPQAEILVPSEFQLTSTKTIPAMTVEKIEEVIQAYGKAARRAVQAGFDAVELHAAHNYLPHTFLSAGFNHRNDCYGGSLENRMRLPLQIIDAIRAELPDSMPLFMRIDAHDDYLEKGLTLEETIAFCKEAKVHGVDVLNVSRGNTVTDALQYEVPPVDLPRGINVENATRIKNETGMSIMVAGRITDPLYAERLIAREVCDLVGIARGQIADPEFCKKAQAGYDDQIVHCIGCNQGCYDSFTDFSKHNISCMRNPAVGRENEISFNPPSTKKNILVAGGGVAGMEASLVLYNRGYNVTLAEKSDHLGGRFLIAGLAPRKAEFIQCTKEMTQAITKSSIKVLLNTDAATLASKPEFESIICAIGAEPSTPPIPCINANWIYYAEEILKGNVLVSGQVIVIGGGLVGIEVAEFCANQGCKVTIVELTDSIGNGLGSLRKICTKQSLSQSSIEIKTNTAVQEINNTGVVVTTKDNTNNSKQLTIPADYVVIATGYSSAKTKDFLSSLPKDKKVFCIGDAISPQKAIEAIHEGFNLAIDL